MEARKDGDEPVMESLLTLDSLEMVALGDIASSKSQRYGVYGVCGVFGVTG